ncbi:MAG: ImmA/IrrE family metallo-endopeptidase [Deltaproteobacteria bacterium]|nr:ImmA/IrrE family metallo-endopeptidase [Deltaproteobacteria bacterium]
MLYADLGSDGPAGLGFADELRGPAVVLNTRGKNTNALVRRFSLAHELCHLVTDWNRMQPLASVSGFLEDAVRPVEQRANAFAVRLLCPESTVRLTEKMREEDAARVLIEEHGLHYQAARLYLENETATIRLPVGRPPAEIQGVISPHPRWVEAEQARGIEDFPIRMAPLERRGVAAQVAAAAYSRGIVPRDAFARYLGIAPTESLEDVLGFFGLDPPGSAQERGA